MLSGEPHRPTVTVKDNVLMGDVFVVALSHSQPRPAGRRRLKDDTRCRQCGKNLSAGSNAYELPDGEPGAFWHKRCLHGRQTTSSAAPVSTLGRRGGTTHATMRTICNLCRKPVHVGDDIVALAPHRWVHRGCVASH